MGGTNLPQSITLTWSQGHKDKEKNITTLCGRTKNLGEGGLVLQTVWLTNAEFAKSSEMNFPFESKHPVWLCFTF